ncbi:MAG: HlyC/CorC family transporter [Treponema sp.]|jgi:CBS domain containing-hemolysin-like protein|nr:HlyC/CorC family transporter [Treponema sp.]
MIFSATENAFLSINKLRLRVLRSKKNKKAQRTGKLLDSKTKLLNTVLIGNNLVNVGVTSILTAIALDMFGANGVEIATIVSTVLLLIFGEITPKVVASIYPEKIAFAVSPLISFLTKVFTPLVWIFSRITEPIAKLFGVNLLPKTVSFTEEDIKTFIDAGEEEGVIEQNEKTMLRQVFKFTDLTAKEIMIPRKEIISISLDSSYQEILDLAQTTSFSKFPVYKNGIDDICGFVYLKDMFFFDDETEIFSVKKIMRPPLFILESRRISSIRKIFRENRQSIAIVVDEYSGTSGLVTIEDLTHEIFGNVSDEDSVENKEYNCISDSSFMVSGSMRLVELSEKLGVELKSEFYDTVGGFITEKLGDFPQENVELKLDMCTLIVKKIDGHRVETVLVKRNAETEDIK